MPPRAAPKATARRRKRAPRNSGNGGDPFIGGLPQQLKTCLKLNAVYSAGPLSSTSSSTYTRWSPNDTYDPLHDSGGGQAMFRDQLFNLYHWSRVTGFKFKVTVFSDSTNPVHLALIPKQEAGATTYSVAAELPGARCGVVTQFKPCTLSLNSNVDTFLRNKQGTSLTDDSFKQGPSASLATQATCNVHLYMYYFGSSGSATLLVQYELMQHAVFSEVIAQSNS